MYNNLLKAMKDKKITFTQIAELLHCQLNTVSDKADGTVKSGFSIDEALLIKKYFSQNMTSYIFLKERLMQHRNKRMFDKVTISLSFICVNGKMRKGILKIKEVK